MQNALCVYCVEEPSKPLMEDNGHILCVQCLYLKYLLLILPRGSLFLQTISPELEESFGVVYVLVWQATPPHVVTVSVFNAYSPSVALPCM